MTDTQFPRLSRIVDPVAALYPFLGSWKRFESHLSLTLPTGGTNGSQKVGSSG